MKSPPKILILAAALLGLARNNAAAAPTVLLSDDYNQANTTDLSAGNVATGRQSGTNSPLGYTIANVTAPDPAGTAGILSNTLNINAPTANDTETVVIGNNITGFNFNAVTTSFTLSFNLAEANNNGGFLGGTFAGAAGSFVNPNPGIGFFLKADGVTGGIFVNGAFFPISNSNITTTSDTLVTLTMSSEDGASNLFSGVDTHVTVTLTSGANTLYSGSATYTGRDNNIQLISDGQNASIDNLTVSAKLLPKH